MKTIRQHTIIPLAIAGIAPNNDPTASYNPWFRLITRRGLSALRDRRTLKLFNVYSFNPESKIELSFILIIKSHPIHTKKSS